MIFADKIIRLRKKNGWSQEELAEKMDTSRQSVSKWEGAQSVPDIGKIIQLAELFGVTTDYLLKDELEDEEYTNSDNDTSVKKLTMKDAADYIENRRKASVKIAVATALCIISPILLMVLGAASKNPANGISENFAGVVGIIALILFVATAVVLFVITGFSNAPYEFLEKEPFMNEYGVSGLVKEKQKAFRNKYMMFNVIGTCLCIISPIPLFIGAFLENKMLLVSLLCAMLFIAAIGVSLFIIAGVQMASMRRILKEGEFAESEKKYNKISEGISTVYWLAAVALYLGLSFYRDDWSKTWILWPIAGVLYAAVSTICNMFLSKDKKD